MNDLANKRPCFEADPRLLARRLVQNRRARDRPDGDLVKVELVVAWHRLPMQPEFQHQTADAPRWP